MAYKIAFRKTALDDLDQLDAPARVRILKKLKWFSERDHPLTFAHRLTNPTIGTYRFRVGDWRVIFDAEDTTIDILVIDRRDRIYRR